MSVLCLWRILVFIFWLQAFLSEICCSVGNTWTVRQLSKEDVLVLKDEENPKCFSRTGEDFTCFFETADNKTFDLFYSLFRVPRTRCDLTVHGTVDGTFLHVCFFPWRHVYLYTDIRIQVVDRTNNTIIYNRTVNVEEHYLLKPPFQVSAKPNGHVGQLDVSWDAEILEDLDDEVEYRIRYSSRSLGEKSTQAKNKHLQLSLVPGEEVEVQVAVKLAFSSDTGHWSSWSQPVRASVPQSADEISLCCTFDLQNVTCHWNGTAYGANNVFKLFYKMSFGDSLEWTEWTECLAADGEVTDACSFHGDNVKKIKLELDSRSDTINRTFFSEAFALNKLIKTLPPRHLKGGPRKDELCLEWEAPLLSPSNHLQYEVNLQVKGGEQWSVIRGPDTDACVKVPSGSQFSVKIRAKPTGSIFLGSWSNWSEVFTCETSAEDKKDLLLLWCVLVPLMIVTICVISIYHSKLKQYFWPAVPNLEKVLQDFLTDINQQKWDPSVITKQCSEETTSSVVEIMSEEEIPGSEKSPEETSELMSSDENFSTGEQVDGSPGTEVLPDYVTLDKELAFICVGANSYVYEQVAEEDDDSLQTCHGSCTDSSTCVGNNYFNHSYLTLSKSAETLNSRISAETAPGNHYTNLPLS